MEKNIFTVKYKKLTEQAVEPKQAEPGSAGYDIVAASIDDPVYESGSVTRIVHTGLSFEFNKNIVMKVYPRSGLAFKHGITLINGTGIIDSSYRGELLVKLIANTVKGAEALNNLSGGDRIAQAVFTELPEIKFLRVDMLSETERGNGGFGSTGV